MASAAPINIPDPRKWHLLLEVCAREICVLAYSLFEGQGMVVKRIPLRDDSLGALEDAVYDHPWLLSDFRRVTVIFDTLRMTTLPAMIEPGSDMWNDSFRRLFPDVVGGEILCSPVEPMRLNIAYEVDKSTLGFIRRSFHNASMRHVLAPLATYFQQKHPSGGQGKMLVNLDGQRMDMVVLGTGGASLALRSFSFREPLDAVYYIMAVRQSLDLPDHEEIMIGGDGVIRASVVPVLREYVRYVMPAIFPGAMLRVGREALRAPFALILSPLT